MQNLLQDGRASNAILGFHGSEIAREQLRCMPLNASHALQAPPQLQSTNGSEESVAHTSYTLTNTTLEWRRTSQMLWQHAKQEAGKLLGLKRLCLDIKKSLAKVLAGEK